MAITFMKATPQAEAPETKPAHMPKLEQTSTTHQYHTALIDEYLGLAKTATEYAMKPLLARMEELRKHLQQIATAEFPAEQEVPFETDNGKVVFGPCADKVLFPHPLLLIEHLILKFGTEAAENCVGIQLTELRKLMSEYELQEFTKTIPGTRTLKKVEFAKPKSAA